MMNMAKNVVVGITVEEDRLTRLVRKLGVR